MGNGIPFFTPVVERHDSNKLPRLFVLLQVLFFYFELTGPMEKSPLFKVQSFLIKKTQKLWILWAVDDLLLLLDVCGEGREQMSYPKNHLTQIISSDIHIIKKNK